MSSVAFVKWDRPPEEVVYVRPPASKSELNRLLVLGALSPCRVRVFGGNTCDDVSRTVEGLEQMGVEIDLIEDGFEIGKGGVDQLQANRKEVVIHSGEGGTTLRFLMAVAACRNGWTSFRIPESLQRRPKQEFIAALCELGATVKNNKDGLAIHGVEAWPEEISIDTSLSSQFVSALLLVRPFLGGHFRIHLLGKTVSRPYVEMTLECLRRFLFSTSWDEDVIEVGHAEALKHEEQLEMCAHTDASSAAIWAAAGFLGWPVGVRKYPTNGQADESVLGFLREFGSKIHRNENGLRVLRRQNHADGRLHVFDLKDCPDLAPLLTVLGSLVFGRTRIQNAHHLRYKESNRIGDLSRSLSNLGIFLREHLDGAEIQGPQIPMSGLFETHQDHRLAMAATLLASRKEIGICDPWCVTKSYPGFWDDATRVGWKVRWVKE